ncbi:MAG: hypothetical protein LBG72_09860, partial [Spirochaetaceae bacterium]|nr:hypothetical protein [Spirochaetaceae bacterium]
EFFILFHIFIKLNGSNSANQHISDKKLPTTHYSLPTQKKHRSDKRSYILNSTVATHCPLTVVFCLRLKA